MCVDILFSLYGKYIKVKRRSRTMLEEKGVRILRHWSGCLDFFPVFSLLFFSGLISLGWQ